MQRIGTSGSGSTLSLTQQVARATRQLNKASLRLATMRRINRASDDPAGLMAAETLRRELRSLEAASRSTDYAQATVRRVDRGFAQATELISRIRGHAVTAASDTTSDEQREALQLEVDAALDALDRLGIHTPNGLDLSVVVGADPTDTATFSIPELSSVALGGPEGSLLDLRSGGTASLASGNAALAVPMLDAAHSQVLSARAAAGAFERYALDASQELIGQASISLSSSLSMIADTDVALETSRLARAQLLVDTSLAGLSASRQSQSLVLQLLS